MTQRIQPSRITLARRLKGWTKLDLAKVLNVSVGAVTLWESGEREPSARLPELADQLGQSEEFLCGPEVPTTDPQTVSFRKRHDAKRVLRDRASCTIDYAYGILTPILKDAFGGLPEPQVPSLKGLEPEVAAQTVRKDWGLSDAPLRNVVEQLEARGVRVFWLDTESPSLSAFCKQIDGEPYVTLSTAMKDGCRSRFDACHELGHLVMHGGLNFDEADPKEFERQANAFSSAFLLPREPFLEDAPSVFDLDQLFELKKVWKVSVSAMVVRLHDLGVYSDWQYQNAFRTISANGWRRSPEPLAGTLEMSRIHWRFCDKLEEQDKAPESFVTERGMKWDDVSEFMPVLKVRQMSLKIDNMLTDDDSVKWDFLFG